MFYKRPAILMFIPVLLLYGSCVSRPVSYNSGFIDKEGVKIAVVHFKDYNVSEGNNSGELVRNVFEDILLKRGYGIVEIEKSAALLNRDLFEKGDVPSKWFIETGGAVGADYMIYGSVHDYSIYQSYTTFIYIFGSLELTSSVGVTARMVSCKTGEIVWSGSLTRKSYTYNDAAEETVSELIRTIRYRSKEKTE